MNCIVCKEDTDRFDKAFQAGFCEGAYCVGQMEMAYGSMDTARQVYRLMYARPDGSTSDTPLLWFSFPVPDTAYNVDAAKYKK